MKKVLARIIAALAIIAAPAGTAAASQGVSLGDAVIKMRIADGVSLDDAAESMKIRANARNIKLVAELPLSEQVKAITGQPQRRMAIYQFCDAPTAKAMVDYDINFAAYLPCRISLVEDPKEPGRGWLVMMDLGLAIKAATLPPEMKAKAEEVRETLEDIMKAGASGDL